MTKKKTQPVASQSGGVQVAGDAEVRGSLVGRDQHNTTTNNITVMLQMAGFTPPPDLADLRTKYLEHIRRQYHALDFKGIPQLDNLARSLALEDVYVPLVARPDLPAGETLERRLAGRGFDREALPADALVQLGKPEAAAPARVEEALRDQPRVVVLGDPGSGKSTLLKHLALRLVSEPDAPLPILVPLNAFADALQRSDRNLQAYLPDYFTGLASGVSDLGPLFTAALDHGQAVILLDGLDEVQRDRPRLAHKVEAFAREAVGRGNKVVVTSRIVGYREAPLESQTWALYTLLDFDDQQIEDFTAKWCLAFELSALGDTPEARAAAATERAGLLAALQANRGVTRLASNPLLLTILALIKRQGVSLPHRRVELYELYLKTLLTAWNKARALDKRQVGPDVDYTQTLLTLAPLALWLREENPTAGLVSERALLDWLTRHFMGEDWGLPRGPATEKAGEFLHSIRRYSNLLIERGAGQYGFIHLTFEEALAAYGLMQAEPETSLAVIQQHLTEPGWRETILLSIGVRGLLNREPRRAGEVVRAMLNMECTGDDVGQNLLLAGECLEDVEELGVGRPAAEAVKQALRAAAHNRSLPPAVQRDAGFILGRVGWAPEDLDQFIAIPAGPFLYGDDKHPQVIAEPFAIAKYPVTNRQYRRFVEAKGYDQREWWSDEGWRWREGTYDSQATEDYEKRRLAQRPPEKRNEPYFWYDSKWNNPLAPVVGVSWFEAEAYSQWLSKELGKPIRLPTEEEWERAARHTDGREYPWGDAFTRHHLNCAEWWGDQDDLDWDKWWDEKGYESASTTIVGQFTEGNSMAGLSDMSGNVWEWTNSWYETKQINRAVRGGSWDVDRRGARCACRFRFVPGFFDDVGFRVLSPGSYS